MAKLLFIIAPEEDFENFLSLYDCLELSRNELIEMSLLAPTIFWAYS